MADDPMGGGYHNQLFWPRSAAEVTSRREWIILCLLSLALVRGEE